MLRAESSTAHTRHMTSSACWSLKAVYWQLLALWHCLGTQAFYSCWLDPTWLCLAWLLKVAALQAEYEAKMNSLKGLKETARPLTRHQKHGDQVMLLTVVVNSSEHICCGASKCSCLSNNVRVYTRKCHIMYASVKWLSRHSSSRPQPMLCFLEGSSAKQTSQGAASYLERDTNVQVINSIISYQPCLLHMQCRQKTWQQSMLQSWQCCTKRVQLSTSGKEIKVPCASMCARWNGVFVIEL